MLLKCPYDAHNLVGKGEGRPLAKPGSGWEDNLVVCGRLFNAIMYNPCTLLYYIYLEIFSFLLLCHFCTIQNSTLLKKQFPEAALAELIET
jgi:hypothetical protein